MTTKNTTTKPFDWHESLRDPQAFLACTDIWFLVDKREGAVVVQSVKYMTDEEVRESIVGDILRATIYEQQMKLKLRFTISELMRHLFPYHHRLVANALAHHEVKALLEQLPDGELRIKNNPLVLQAAMGYAGEWYSGHAPSGEAIDVDSDKLNQLIEQHGGIDNLAAAMAMELDTDHPMPSTKQ